MVVFADELDAPYVERVPIPPPGRVITGRWAYYAAYLAARPDVRMVFLTDARDVTCLHDPFPHMEPGVIYCGSEPQVLGCPWMLRNHPPPVDWLRANAGLLLLNCGLVGGDRLTVLHLARRMAEEIEGRDLEHDMGPLNYIVYAEALPFVTGPLVHTRFKAEETDSPAWFKHK